MNISKLLKTLTSGLICLAVTGCYEPYVHDYDYSGVYIAYQYDLRTFVIGEDMSFKFTVALGGVINNDQDRSVQVALDNSLVTGNLAEFSDTLKSYTAMDAIRSSTPAIGAMSNAYVRNDIAAAGITRLVPLPEDYYYIEPSLSKMKIRKGEHVDAVTIHADSLYITTDPGVFKPKYALGFRILSADADTVIRSKSFAVIAVRCENKFYGNWYHGGVSTVTDASGNVLSRTAYPTAIPQSESAMYVLKSVDAATLTSNRLANGSGSLRLCFDGDEITVTDASGQLDIHPVEGKPSRFNGAKLLQDRKLFLNYRYELPDGNIRTVCDTLTFRNRVRDGINEWQDENPEHYK